MLEIIWQLCMGAGLAAAAGLRAFLPLLVIGLAGRADVIGLGERFEWLASTEALVVFAAAVAIEVLADKVPIVDHALDAVGTFARPVAGMLAAAAPLTATEPLTAAAVGIILGGAVAGTVQTLKAGTRVLSTGATGGLANPVVSAVEDAASLTASLAAIFVPVAAAVVLLVAVVVLARRRRPASAAPFRG